jgi:hypothetical protein
MSRLVVHTVEWVVRFGCRKALELLGGNQLGTMDNAAATTGADFSDGRELYSVASLGCPF